MGLDPDCSDRCLLLHNQQASQVNIPTSYAFQLSVWQLIST